MVSTDANPTLPYGTTFVNKHSSEHNWRIAEDNLLVLFEAGSTLHGTKVSSQADYDLYGICVEPPEVMLGTHNSFEEYHYRSVARDEKSGAGDVDCNVYGLSKWVHQACEGNFNHLLALFVPLSSIRYDNVWFYRELLDHRDMFLARSHAERIQGYLIQQRKDILGNQRPGLIAEHGYDTKAAYHALRIALQGWQLMAHGHIPMPMRADEQILLKKLRTGAYTLDQVLRRIANAEADLAYAVKSSKLPAEINYDQINAWLPGFYQRFWESR